MNRVKTKVMFNLTKRQLICFALAAAAGVPIFFLTTVSYTHLDVYKRQVLQTLVVALGAGLAVWGVVNLMEGYGNDNRATRS